MFIIISLGILVGFTSSIPSGPIGVHIISVTLKERRRYAIAIGLGAAIMDVLYIFIALTGISFIHFSSQSLFWIQIIGILFLTFLGIKEIRFKAFEAKKEESNAPKKRTHFFLGVLLYITNPIVFLSYTAIATIIKSYELYTHTLVSDLIFSVCLGLGALLWFALLAFLVHKIKDRINITIIRKISIGSGIFLLGTAIYLSFRLFI